MKSKLIIAGTFLSLVAASAAFADDSAASTPGATKPTPGQIQRRGERAERRLNKNGDRIETRMDAKADKARAAGNDEKADKLEKKGERIDNRLDRKGERIEQRHEHRAQQAK
jgi:hypothetical protein